MSDAQKKVFLSYRRKLGGWIAHAVYLHLRENGYDVFMDVESLGSGEFPPVILNQIEARPHFLIVLVPGTLERTVDEGDWLRREIEHALHSERNIVPLLAEAFSFKDEEKRLKGKRLPTKVSRLEQHNGIDMPSLEYFEAFMTRLTGKFLKKEVKVAVKSTPLEDEPTVRRMLINAEQAKTEPFGDWFWSNKMRLDAPKLSRSRLPSGWEWTTILGASGYVLQKSHDEAFKKVIDLYNGDQTMYAPSSLLTYASTPKTSIYTRSQLTPKFGLPDDLDWTDFSLGQHEYYRVKAKGGFAFLDSPWSEVVKVELARRAPLKAPVLARSATGDWTWTRVDGATGYVLQESYTDSFEVPMELYDGADSAFTPALSMLGLDLTRVAFGLSSTKYYRVKAKSGRDALDSPWSNVVRVERSPKKALDAPVLEREGSGWKWTSVTGASSYLLQMSDGLPFDSPFYIDKPVDVYDGPATRWPRTDPFISPAMTRRESPWLRSLEAAADPPRFRPDKYYRVKARGGPASLDSPWSNVVKAPHG